MYLDSLTLFALFVGAILLGKFFKFKVPDFLFKSIVMVLVFTISFWASASGLATLLQSIATSLAILVLIVASLIVLGYLLDAKSTHTLPVKPESRVDPLLIASIAAGWLTGLWWGQTPPQIIGEIITLEVYLVVGVTGFAVSNLISLDTVKRGGITALKAVLLSLTSALTAGALASYILQIAPGIALGIVLGLGWYSFAGPFIAQIYGPSWGFTAFLVNVLREQLTFIIVPLIRKPFIPMVSLGGATTMDNTLPVYTYVYGEEASIVSIIHGLILTLSIPFLEGIIASLG